MNRYQKRDSYYKKAKEKGYAARSVFKLEDIDKKYALFSKNQMILDLGCSPGSWAQYVSKRISPDGKLIGIDLEPLKQPIEGLTFHHGAMQTAPYDQLLAPQGWVNGVISDMAPKTSGDKFTDQCGSLDLCHEAFSIAIKYLRADGFFLCKIFEGPDTKGFEIELKQRFSQVTRIKPQAVRKGSKEFYFLCLGFKEII